MLTPDDYQRFIDWIDAEMLDDAETAVFLERHGMEGSKVDAHTEMLKVVRADLEWAKTRAEEGYEEEA